MNWIVIMAGGSGERFWPLSRRAQPKQLQAIVTKRTMIQETVARVRPLVPMARMVVVTNREQAAMVRKQLPGLRHLLIEPVGRNTAPCCAWAAAYVAQRDPAAVMAVLPADAHINDVARYRVVLSSALDLAARRDVLVTIGIRATRPATSYGYVRLGEPLGAGFWQARQFVEKPDLARAEEFVASGEYRWNAGMFVWNATAIRAAFLKHAPKIWKTIRHAKSVPAVYPKLEKISVDYAVMEKADNVVVANGDFDWDDVGDWPALARHLPADAAGNVVRGEFYGVDASDNVVVSLPGHAVAALGVKDLVIVHTRDATLICPKSEAQRVRDVVKKLAEDRQGRRLV